MQIKHIRSTKYSESKKLNSKTISFSEKLETIHQEVNAYLLTQSYSEPYSYILDKFSHKHINNKFTLEQNALIEATIENTLDNDTFYKNLTIPINLNRKSSTLSQQTRNFQNSIILKAKQGAQTLKV